MCEPRKANVKDAVLNPLTHEGENREVRRRRRKEETVETVEHPAVGAEEVAAVLDAGVALEERLEEVSDRRGECEHDPEDDRLADREEVLLVESDERDEDRRCGSEDEPLPGLPGRRG